MTPLKVIVFGAFDPLHAGHTFFLEQAKSLGSYLTVVLARDSSIRIRKHREPYETEVERKQVLQRLSYVDEVILGNENVNQYNLLSELSFDIVAMGYDQFPADEALRAELDARNKKHVIIKRLPAYKPEVYKSTFLRPKEDV